MREIRTFEMERDEPAAVWRIAEPSLVTVMAGQLWITVERDAEDYWLRAGESLWLPKGARAWIGAGGASARFTVANAGTRAAPQGKPARPLRAPRRLLPV